MKSNPQARLASLSKLSMERMARLKETGSFHILNTRNIAFIETSD